MKFLAGLGLILVGWLVMNTHPIPEVKPMVQVTPLPSILPHLPSLPPAVEATAAGQAIIHQQVTVNDTTTTVNHEVSQPGVYDDSINNGPVSIQQHIEVGDGSAVSESTIHISD